MSSEQIVSEFYSSVGERVRMQRKGAGMDQETLSRHLGLSRTTVINIEKGRQRLSLEQAWLTAQVLNISITDLLPPIITQSVDDWAKKIGDEEINPMQKKGVMQWISKAQTKKTRTK